MLIMLGGTAYVTHLGAAMKYAENTKSIFYDFLSLELINNFQVSF